MSDRLRALFVLFSLPSAAAGCRDVLATDEFAVDPRADPCGALEVRSGDECVPVGVGDGCGDGFGVDGAGGCLAKLPEGACADGEYMRPGLASCSPLFTICTTPLTPDVIRVGGTPDPSSPDRWFARLDEALAESQGDVSIALAPGDHFANVEIRDRRVHIFGGCSDRTRLIAEKNAPVLRLGPGSDRSKLELFTVTGEAPGILVSGATDVVIHAVRAHALSGPGIVFDDAGGWSARPADYKPTSGTIDRSLIDAVTDIGVGVYGAAVTLNDVQIARTRPLGPGLRAHGLVVRPTPVFSMPELAPIPQLRHPGTVTLSRSLIEDSAGAGVIVEGSELVVDSTVIRRVAPDRARHGRGIEVRAHTPGQIPARLELRRSIVEQVFDVGVSLWNADSARIENSVIRDVGEAMTGRCLGNGIRARYDLARDVTSEPRLELSRSLIERTHQAGVHIEGGRALLQDSIIRDARAEPCRDDFGDGVAIHASATGASDTALERLRIENVARAGVASHASTTRVDSVLVACSGQGLAASGGELTSNGARCGCSGAFPECRQPAPLAPSLIGGSGCRADDQTVCYRGCSGTVTQQQSLLSRATVWPYDHEEIPSVLSDENGCYEIEGLPANEPVMMAIAHDTHVSGLGMVAPLAADSPRPYRADLLEASLLPFGLALVGPLDLRKVYVLLARVCAPGSAPVGCPGYPGLTLSLAPGPADKTLYFNDESIPSSSLRATVSSDVIFHNVVPGEHTITVAPPAGQGVRCAPEQGGMGWLDGPNRLRVQVEEGFTIVGGELLCTRE